MTTTKCCCHCYSRVKILFVPSPVPLLLPSLRSNYLCAHMDRRFGAVCDANCVAAFPGFSSVSHRAKTGSC